MGVEAIVIGAAMGAGTAAATGGDIGKGAMFGAAGGAIGGAAAAGTAGGMGKVGGAVVGGLAGGAAGTALLPGESDIEGAAVASSSNDSKTATPVKQLSETAKKNKSRAAAFQPRSFAPPKLGQSGLLGISG